MLPSLRLIFIAPNLIATKHVWWQNIFYKIVFDRTQTEHTTSASESLQTSKQIAVHFSQSGFTRKEGPFLKHSHGSAVNPRLLYGKERKRLRGFFFLSFQKDKSGCRGNKKAKRGTLSNIFWPLDEIEVLSLAQLALRNGLRFILWLHAK